jgi:phage-related protein
LLLYGGNLTLHEILFYKDKNGNEPALEYIRELQKSHSKDSRIKLTKIQDYMKILSIQGTMAGEPFVKHIEGDIWELRPLKNRFFFVAWHNDSFVVLHQFTKKTKKTPKSEIEKAQREYRDLKERS